MIKSKKDSILDDLQPLTPQKGRSIDDELQITESSLQTWIEDVLHIEFDKGSALAPFYTTLESGQVLCQLVHALFPDHITMSSVHLFSSDPAKAAEKTKSSDFLSHAKSNVDVFIKSMKSIGIQCNFTFENLYLHKNKSAILECLQELRSRSEKLDEVDLRTPVASRQLSTDEEYSIDDDFVVIESSSSISSSTSGAMTKHSSIEKEHTQVVEQKRQSVPQKLAATPVVTKQVEEESLAFDEGFMQGLIALYSLPFVIVFVLISRLFHFTQSK